MLLFGPMFWVLILAPTHLLRDRFIVSQNAGELILTKDRTARLCEFGVVALAVLLVGSLVAQTTPHRLGVTGLLVGVALLSFWAYYFRNVLAPASFVFDRARDELRRGERRVCALSEVDGVRVVRELWRHELRINYHNAGYGLRGCIVDNLAPEEELLQLAGVLGRYLSSGGPARPAWRLSRYEPVPVPVVTRRD
jgi:hypothetical protein